MNYGMKWVMSLVVAWMIIGGVVYAILIRGRSAHITVPCDHVVLHVLGKDDIVLRPREPTDGPPRTLSIYRDGEMITRINETGTCRS